MTIQQFITATARHYTGQSLNYLRARLIENGYHVTRQETRKLAITLNIRYADKRQRKHPC